MLTLLLASANAAPGEERPAEFNKEDGTLYIDWSGPIVAGMADDLRAALGKYGTTLNRVVSNARSLMIVCSCNVLTDHDTRIVVTASREQPLSELQVYGCLGCSIRCGRCARAIKRIITEASIACAEGCACCSAVRSAV